MSKIKLKKFQSVFRDSLSEYNFEPQSNPYDDSELFFNTPKGKLVISFQATKSQENFKLFEQKIKFARKEKHNLIPIFLAREGFVFKYEGNLQRVQNVGECTNDIYGVSNKVKFISREKSGKILVYKSNEENYQNGVLQIHKTLPVSGKSRIPSMKSGNFTDLEWEEEKLSKKYQEAELERALHFTGTPRIYRNLEFFLLSI